MRVLITGSRTWTNVVVIRRALRQVEEENPNETGFIAVHGDARGADGLVDFVASQFGWLIERHLADWDAHGKAAGPIRNQQMVDLGADLCLAFIRNNSRGATQCAAAAEEAGIPVRVFDNVDHEPIVRGGTR